MFVKDWHLPYSEVPCDVWALFFWSACALLTSGGFSMGGCMAMHLAYRNHRDVAGVFALSSFLNKDSAIYKVSSTFRNKYNVKHRHIGSKIQLIVKQWNVVPSWCRLTNCPWNPWANFSCWFQEASMFSSAILKRTLLGKGMFRVTWVLYTELECRRLESDLLIMSLLRSQL